MKGPIMFRTSRLSLVLLLLLVLGLTACSAQTPEPAPTEVVQQLNPVQNAPESATEANPPTETPPTVVPETAEAYPEGGPINPLQSRQYPYPYPSEENNPNVEAQPAPESTARTCEPPAVPEKVTYEGADGLQIVGDLYLPAGEDLPAVLLLHMLGSSRADWVDFANTLASNCYAALAVDMRGHGDTQGEVDWTKALEDLQNGLQYLENRPEINGSMVAITGASIGANMALRTAAVQPEVKTVVLLSPGLDYAGVTTEDALAQYGERPILIIASEEDTYAASSSQTLASQALGLVNLKMYQGAGHGTAILTNEPDTVGMIIDWLNTNVK
jgi:dienelactone hydrolase